MAGILRELQTDLKPEVQEYLRKYLRLIDSLESQLVLLFTIFDVISMYFKFCIKKLR